MYEKGQGVTQDYNKAFEMYELAAKQGLASAQYNLGRMYYYGKGVAAKLQRNPSRCMNWQPSKDLHLHNII